MCTRANVRDEMVWVPNDHIFFIVVASSLTKIHGIGKNTLKIAK